MRGMRKDPIRLRVIETPWSSQKAGLQSTNMQALTPTRAGDEAVQAL